MLSKKNAHIVSSLLSPALSPNIQLILNRETSRQKMFKLSKDFLQLPSQEAIEETWQIVWGKVMAWFKT